MVYVRGGESRVILWQKAEKGHPLRERQSAVLLLRSKSLRGCQGVPQLWSCIHHPSAASSSSPLHHHVITATRYHLFPRHHNFTIHYSCHSLTITTTLPPTKPRELHHLTSHFPHPQTSTQLSTVQYRCYLILLWRQKLINYS